MPNIEIKAKTEDLEKYREIAKKISTQHLGLDRQTDTYFATKKGRLKLRESSLSGTYLIPYLRPDSAHAKKSDYALLTTQDGTKAKELLAELLGVTQVVRKTRDIYLIDNVRVHLDEVERLGKFLEFEAVYFDPLQEAAEFKKVNDLLKIFGVSESDLLKNSYTDM